MEGAASAEALRRAAPRWTLAGDRDLLAALQSLHERIISKCQETNTQLEEMVTALDNANIHLQNVNNKFTALSNSQFIESRVYDDDADVITDAKPPEEKPKLPSTDLDIERMKESLRVLESMHERVTILCDSDSDSESDTDDDTVARVVLKPKDLYADRPLPHIIGSQAWKSKWHAGLLPDDSDSGSSTSKRDVGDQFSDSEPDQPSDYQHGFNSETLRVPVRHDRTMSSSSSELHSEPVTHPKPSQSDIAAELARRLGGHVTKVREPVEEFSPPRPATRPSYQPKQPLPGAIFSDEPPPLDMDQSEDSDQDIFAEIHKNKPYSHSSREQSTVADDLFGRPVTTNIDSKPPPKPSVKETSPLFDDESEPELFAAKPKPATITAKDEVSTKKPIGGMSLFGNNAESIGAAILKRNQRKSSTSDEESDSIKHTQHITKETKPQTVNTPLKEAVTTKSPDETSKTPQRQVERDIFDDLFAKSKERERKEKEKQGKDKVVSVKEPVKANKVDLFSDNIFDDIDDIFTDNVVPAPKVEKEKIKTSIFDENDDLFSDIAVSIAKTDKIVKDTESMSSKEKEKGIFSNDEDLFSNKPEMKNKVSENPSKVNQIKKQSKNLFDSDDDLFSDVTGINVTKISNKPDTVDTKRTEKVTVAKIKTSSVKSNVAEDLFGDDDEESLFTSKKEKPNIVDKMNIAKEPPKLIIKNNEENIISKTVDDVKVESSEVTKSPNIFDDDEMDDFFTSAEKRKVESDQSKNSISAAKSKKYNNDESPTEIENDDLFKPKTSVPHDKNQLFEKDNKKRDTSDVNQMVSDDKTLKSKIEDETRNSSNKDVARPIEKEVGKPSQENFSKSVVFNDTSDTENIFNNYMIQGNIISDKGTKVTSHEDDIPKQVSTSNNKDTPNLETAVHHTAFYKTTPLHKTTVDAYKNITDIPKNSSDEKIKRENQKHTTIDTKNKETVTEINENVKQDIFTDIFNDQPPVFEKPKEPKKSKNVNALFDDDSDDENLFFKKNDVTLEEVPEDLSSPSEDRLFGIFRDEPPAIDTDFLQKPTKKDTFADEIQNLTKDSKDTNEKDIFNVDETIKTEKVISSTDIKDDVVEKCIKSDIFSDISGGIFKNPIEGDIFGEESSKNVIPSDDFDKMLKDDEDLFKTHQKQVTNTQTEQDKTTIQSESIDKPDGPQAETKKIGKLKPMNFNINVNTLLPGVSPKKAAKSVEQTDGQTISTKSYEELRTNEVIESNTESKLVKSVSFEGKPESNVLDNKLSKERAKIQVKRRPSTRKARREAVKKSGIDFGEDSTDNSSSIDDQPRGLVITKDKETPTVTTEDSRISKGDILGDDVQNVYRTKELDSSTDIDSKFTSSTDEKTSKTETTPNENVENIAINKTIGTIPKTSPNRDVKSKVVYILNDEDIFNTTATKEPVENFKKGLNIVVDDDDLFNAVKPPKVGTSKIFEEPKKLEIFDSDDENLFNTTAKAVKGKEDTTKPQNKLKDAESPKQRPSIFGDLDDDETALFSSRKTVTEKQKVSLFGSDSEEDLFSGAKKVKEVKAKSLKMKKEIKRVEVNGSLFGDEDDDDLFGAKPKNAEPKLETEHSKPKEPLSKTTEPVFEDPLSLLGRDDD